MRKVWGWDLSTDLTYVQMDAACSSVSDDSLLY